MRVGSFRGGRSFIGFRRFPFGFRNHFFFFDRCFGCFSPFFFNGGFFLGSPFYPYYPFYPGDYYGYGYGPTYSQPVASDYGYNNSDQTAQLSADVQQLSDEVADLRAEEGSRDFSERNSSGTSLSAKEPATATVFIFTDGRRISAKSYAIAGSTLWIFDEHTARKYQISELDAAATEKANAANGVEFHVPETKR